MPSINKIRLSNIKYSHGQKYYDDIILDVDGKSFLVEYANGGGKTFLAQCMMQTILPKSHFTAKHPIEELFDNENKNNTIHSLVEWKLDAGSEYKYLVTGFCARKKMNQGAASNENSDLDEKSKIDYFNYIYMYNDDASYNISNIPLKEADLSGNIRRMNYSELRKFIRGLNPTATGGDNCFAEIFDIKSKYSKLLKEFKINTTEWELLKDANFTEGYLPHFLGKYSTSKSFIQEFLIPQIDKANELHNQGDYQDSESRAESLLDIKETLVDYSKRIEDKKELDKLEIALNELLNINEELLEVFTNRDSIKTNVTKSYNKVINDMDDIQANILEITDEISSINTTDSELEDSKNESKENINSLKSKIKELKSEIETFKMYKAILSMREDEKLLESKHHELEDKGVEIKGIENNIDNVHKKELLFKAEDKYVNYLKEESVLIESYEIKENYEKSQAEIIDKLKLSGGHYKFLLEKEKNKTTDEISNSEHKELELYELLKEKQSLRDGILSKITISNLNLNNLNMEINIAKNHRKDLADNLKDLLNSLNAKSLIDTDILELVDTLAKEVISTLTTNTNLENISNSKNTIDSSIKKIKDSIHRYNELITSDTNEILKLSNIVDAVLNDEHGTFKFIHELSLSLDKLNSLEELLSTSLTAIISALKVVMSDTETLLAKLKGEHNDLDVKLYKKTEDKKSVESKIEEINNDIVNKENNLSTYNNELSKLSLVLNKYNNNDIYNLNSNLLELKFEKVNNLNALENEKSTLEMELEKLKSNKGLVLKGRIEECYLKIKSKYPNALLGVDFLKGLSVNEKKSYLDKTDSLIAYSILLSSNDFISLNKNLNLISDFKDDLVPIIDITSIKDDNKIDLKELYLTRRSSDEILDEEKIAKEIDKKCNAIEKLTITILNEKADLNGLTNDLDLLNQFIMKYNETYMKDLLNDIDKLKSNKYQLEDKKSGINLDINELNNLKVQNEDKTFDFERFIAILNGHIADINNIEAKLLDTSKSMINIHNQHLALINLLIEFNKATTEMISNLNSVSDIKNEIIEYEVNRDNLNSDINVIESQRIDIVNNIAKLSSIIGIYEDTIKSIPYEPISVENLSLDNSKAIYKSIEATSLGKISDLNRVNEEIARTKDRMNLIDTEIQELGYSIDEFRSSNKTFISHSVTDYATIVSEINNLNSILDIAKSQYNDINVAINKLEGKIDHIKEDILEKYQVDANTFVVPDINIEESISRNRNDISSKNEEINALNDNISEIEKAQSELKNNKNELEQKREDARIEESNLDKMTNRILNLAESAQIDLSSTDECADNLDYVSKDKNSNMSMAEKDLRISDRKIKSLKEKHSKKIENTKNSLTTSVFKIKDDLDEILPPESLDDTKMQIDAINGDFGYLTILEEEKSTLESDLKALEESFSAFIELCIQRANYAYDKLKEIEDFSKVKIGEKNQETIRVKLNLLPEDEQVVKMRNYINKIVLDTEDDKTTREDKIKYLSKSLELKNLFPQIVSNIDKCKVEIFKVNDTCDGGLFLPWGKAGSTGQTNSMYVFMFMCIMTYIRRLSTYNIKDESRQLIFLDNPFAGTVAANLWKIPVDLMKKNNIQFMCLGYDIPANLTGMFDVRYSLGGKLMSTNVQTVEVIGKEVVSKREDGNSYNIFNLETVE